MKHSSFVRVHVVVLNYKQSDILLDKFFFQMDSAATFIIRNYVQNINCR